MSWLNHFLAAGNQFEAFFSLRKDLPSPTPLTTLIQAKHHSPASSGSCATEKQVICMSRQSLDLFCSGSDIMFTVKFKPLYMCWQASLQQQKTASCYLGKSIFNGMFLLLLENKTCLAFLRKHVALLSDKSSFTLNEGT